MIRKTDKLIVTFFTTTDAMAMERLCREKRVPGRIIPVPGAISANCGLAWCTVPEEEQPLRELLAEKNLRFQGIYRCLV